MSENIVQGSGPSRRQGKVRWRRAALMLVPSLGAAGALIALTASGVLASSVSVSGQQFTVAADQLQGTQGFAQYGALIQPTGSSNPVPVAVSVVPSATLTNLCQSVQVPVVGGYLKLTAGTGSTPVSASNLLVAASSLTGSSAQFTNMVIGQDAGTLKYTDPNAPSNVQPTPGTFGEQADTVTISTLRQQSWLTTAGTFTLPGLSLSFTQNGC